MEKISGIYKITNTVTGDFYIGSSKDIKQRWSDHKCQSVWKKCPNKKLYQDMKKFGVDKFELQILAEAEPEQLKEAEQRFIEELKPTYNNYNAYGLDIERRKEYHKEYQKSNKYKESKKEYNKSDKGKESRRKASNKYNNQLCLFKGETLTLHALYQRFRKAGIPHPVLEAKKYLLQ